MAIHINIHKPDATNFKVDLIQNGSDIPSINVTFSNKSIIIPKYYGTYSVTPSREDQILETKDKYLQNDITVYKIPSIYGEIYKYKNNKIRIY